MGLTPADEFRPGGSVPLEIPFSVATKCRVNLTTFFIKDFLPTRNTHYIVNHGVNTYSKTERHWASTHMCMYCMMQTDGSS
jgi:hypothetical protein